MDWTIKFNYSFLGITENVFNELINLFTTIRIRVLTEKFISGEFSASKFFPQKPFRLSHVLSEVLSMLTNILKIELFLVRHFYYSTI